MPQRTFSRQFQIPDSVLVWELGRVLPGTRILDLGIRGMYGEYDGSSFALTPIEFEGSSTSLDLSLMEIHYPGKMKKIIFFTSSE